MSKELNVTNFIKTNRGQFILAQALHEAIKAMSAVKDPWKERSNISDMEFILDKAFPSFKELLRVQDQVKAAKLKEREAKG